MKRGLYTLMLATALTVVLTLAAQTAQAQSTTLTDDQIDRIRSNCTSIKSTLNQLHASDTASESWTGVRIYG
jgi:hypothetical protein